MSNNNNFQILRSLTNQELKELTVEIKKIGDSNAPAKENKTQMFTSLLNNESAINDNFICKFQNLDTKIAFEVLHRFREGLIN